MKWFIENQINKERFYFNGYLEAVNNYKNLAKELNVIPQALVIKFEKIS